MELLQRAGVPASAVQDGKDLFADAHLRARGFMNTVDHPSTGAIEYPDVPLRLWADAGEVWAGGIRWARTTDMFSGIF